MPVGAPRGNKNACKENRLWRSTLHRAITQENSKRLRLVADALITKAMEGDVPAIRELGDRLDGKVSQPIEGPGDDGALLIRWLGKS